jgi:hypothetical protein
MADWCQNLLTVTGSAEEVSAFVTKAKGIRALSRYERENPIRGAVPPDTVYDLSFHSLYPVPDDLLDSTDNHAVIDWEYTHWGVKLGACNPRIKLLRPSEVQYSFETAWGPPPEFVTKVAADFPSLRFEMRSWGGEESYGTIVWEGGKRVSP